MFSRDPFYLNQCTNSLLPRIIIFEYCHFSRHLAVSEPRNNFNMSKD